MKKFFYRVSQGETVLSVAQKTCVPIGIIIKNNNLKEEISCGDLLYIEKSERKVYKVMPFDTAKSVAKKFCVDENKILKENGVPYLFYGLTIYL